MEHKQVNFYCYTCQQQFTAVQTSNQCRHCLGEVIEMLEAQQSANTSVAPFRPYQIPPQSNNTVVPQPVMNQNTNFPIFGTFEYMTSFPNNQMGSPSFSINIVQMSNSLFGMMNNMVGRINGNLQTFFNQLPRQSQQIRATAQEITSLQQINHVKQCAICQQIDEADQQSETTEEKTGYRLKCGHQFHKNCISVWFQRTNTCPTCRQRI